VNSKESMKNGMPTSCKDLNELGYTLKGFHLVKNANLSVIETIFCDFKETPLSGIKSKYLYLHLCKQDLKFIILSGYHRLHQLFQINPIRN